MQKIYYNPTTRQLTPRPVASDSFELSPEQIAQIPKETLGLVNQNMAISYLLPNYTSQQTGTGLSTEKDLQASLAKQTESQAKLKTDEQARVSNANSPYSPSTNFYNSGNTNSNGTSGTGSVGNGINSSGGSTTSGVPNTNSQLALLGAIADVASNTYSTKNSGLTLDEALKTAQNDPNIIAKYSDMLKLDTQGFQQQLAQLQQATSTTEQQRQTQFENERRQLAESSAATGQAYSGLRNRAQEQLGKQQSGIVESSRSTLKKSLQDLTTAFEQKYGTAASQAATAQFKDPLASSGISLSGLKTDATPNISTLSGEQAGGITGTQSVAQQNDILKRGTDLFNVGQLPSFKTA